MLAKPDERRLCVGVWPNEAGLKLPERVAEAKETDECHKTEVGDIAAEADALEAEQRVEGNGRGAAEEGADASSLGQRCSKALAWKRNMGRRSIFAETHDFRILDEDLWEKLKLLPAHDIARELFRGRAGWR